MEPPRVPAPLWAPCLAGPRATRCEVCKVLPARRAIFLIIYKKKKERSSKMVLGHAGRPGCCLPGCAHGAGQGRVGLAGQGVGVWVWLFGGNCAREACAGAGCVWPAPWAAQNPFYFYFLRVFGGQKLPSCPLRALSQARSAPRWEQLVSRGCSRLGGPGSAKGRIPGSPGWVGGPAAPRCCLWVPAWPGGC